MITDLRLNILDDDFARVSLTHKRTTAGDVKKFLSQFDDDVIISFLPEVSGASLCFQKAVSARDPGFIYVWEHRR